MIVGQLPELLCGDVADDDGGGGTGSGEGKDFWKFGPKRSRNY